MLAAFGGLGSPFASLVAGYAAAAAITPKTVSIKDFGARGDGVADDTEAFMRAAAALTKLGSGTLLIPSGTYKVAPAVGSTVAHFQNCKGLIIRADGALINDVRSYARKDSATLLQFSACDGLQVTGLQITSESYGPFYEFVGQGLIAIRCVQGTANFVIDLTMTGGNVGVQITGLSKDLSALRCRNGRVTIKATQLHYPFNCQFSGDQMDVQVDATDCGRAYFVYGVKDHKAVVRIKNPRTTSKISSYEGRGCENMDVTFESIDSVDSTNTQFAALSFSDSTPAAHRNIRIRLNVKNNPGRSFAQSFQIQKSGNGGKPEAKGVGHVIDGFELTGVSEQAGSNNHVDMGSGMAFVAPDEIRNFSIRNLEARSPSSGIALDLSAMTTTSVFEAVTTQHNLIIVGNLSHKLVFTKCRAGRFTWTASDKSLAEYISCDAFATGGNQSKTNKTFVNTYVDGVLLNSPLTDF